MLKYLIPFVIFATLVAGSNPKFRIANGEQVGSIVNGQVHNPGTFKYAVVLRLIRYYARYFPQVNRVLTVRASGRCGGSIIRADLVLTAAHCVENMVPQNVTAFAGIVHVAKPQPSAQFIRGRRIVSHANYEKYFNNDIALIFLAESFEITAYVDTITLGRPHHYQGGMNLTAVGWGDDENGVLTPWLYRADLKMFDSYTCAYKVGLYEKVLCAIDSNQVQKICSGDSGGPVMSNNVLVGISVGTMEYLNAPSGTCDPTYPSIFTNVSYYRSWIDSQIRHDELLQIWMRVH